MESEKIIVIFDPIYTFCEVVDYIDLNKCIVNTNLCSFLNFYALFNLKMTVPIFTDTGHFLFRTFLQYLFVIAVNNVTEARSQRETL